MTTFRDRFQQALYVKDSILCIGLDPALPGQREKNVIPERYVKRFGPTEGRLQFCMDILDQASPFAIAAKPNEQYTFGFSTEQHRRLVDYIHDKGLFAIDDCKLGDIDDTAESKIFWMHQVGYDAITAHTQQGNLDQLVKFAHSHEPQIGVIALTLMSNPGAVKGFKESKTGDKPDYLAIAEDVKATGADGVVVGSTGHVTEDEISAIVNACGRDKFLLSPGVGAQQGDYEKIIRNWGENLVINVGRGIMNSPNPAVAAEEWNLKFNEARVFYGMADILLETPGAFGVDALDPRILVSKRASCYYADNRKIPSKPDAMDKTNRYTLSMLRWKVKRKPDRIVTTATAGISFAAVDSHELKIGMAYVRDRPKGHGTETTLEGEVKEGEWILVRDDLVTTLGTITKAVNESRKRSGVVEYAIVNVTRSEYSPQDLQNLGLNLIAFLSIDKRFAEYARRKGRITEDQFSALSKYTEDPLGWSRNFVQSNTPWLKRKIQAGIKDGRFESRDALEVLTKTHTDLLPNMSQWVRKWLEEAGLQEKVPEVGYTPVVPVVVGKSKKI